MCYHNSLAAKARELAARYDRGEISFDEMRFLVSAFTNSAYPIITKHKKIRLMKWGLIPQWLKPRAGETAEDTVKQAEALRKGTYNAKAETVFEKPSYRDAIKHSRCLIPATGFFEYHYNPDKSITPYYISLKSEKIFSMGGIFSQWTNPLTGEKIETFSQITIEPNALMRHIHNGGKNPFRMPLIISRENEENWMDARLTTEDIENLMKPYHESDMLAAPVSSDFIRLDSHDPRILEYRKDTLF